MKTLATLTAFFSLALSAQENIQNVTAQADGTPRLIPWVDLDDNAGGPDYRFERYWEGALGQANFLFRINPQQEVAGPLLVNYDLNERTAFETYNNAQPTPLLLLDVTRSLSTPPAHGTFTFSNNVDCCATNSSVYTPVKGYVGTDTVIIAFTSNGNVVATTRVNITVLNSNPSASLAAAPGVGVPGTPFTLSPAGTDPDGHSLTFSYDYGDGDTGTSPQHSYAAPGVYTVTVTASDGFNGSATATTQLTVFGTDHAPEARFSTDHVVAGAGVAFGFDATRSTDPQNQPLTFVWDFGDGSPLASGSIVARKYKDPGTVTVTLTVTDSEGLSSTVSRELDVLTEPELLAFDAEISFSVNYNRGLANKDKIALFARLNLGSTLVKAGDTVSVSIGTKTFTGTLDKRFRATASFPGGGGQKFQVKARTSGRYEGSVEIRLTATKAADLGDALNLLGLAGSIDEAQTPVTLGISGKTYSVDVPSEYDSTGLLKGKGKGEF